MDRPSGSHEGHLSKEKRRLIKRQHQEQLKKCDRLLLNEGELKVKLIIVGDSGVGKTSLLMKFLDETADIRTPVTNIQADFKHCKVRLAGRTVGLRMWDTAGMEQFHRALPSNFYRHTQALMLVFSLDDRDSFDNLPSWLEVVEQYASVKQMECCVVGNKSDKEPQVVNSLEAQRFANSRGYTYIETSAKNVLNVNKAFNDLVIRVIRRQEIVGQLNEAKTVTLHSRDGRRQDSDCKC